MKKRILIISYEFPPLVGGAGTYSRELAVGLSRNNCKVHVLTCYHGKREDSINTDKFLFDDEGIVVSRFRAISKLFFMQLSKYINTKWSKNFQDKFDNIILSDSRATRYAILRFNESQLVKSTHVFHGGEILSFHLQPNFRIRMSGINKKFVSALLKSQASITVSEDLRNIFITQLPELKHKIHTVLHGIDDKIFKPLSNQERETIRNELSVYENEIVILSASRLVVEKGQDKLIEAFSHLAEEHSNVKLLIAGDGRYKSQLESQVEQLRLGKRIRFLGALSRSKLAEIMAACDFFALMSRAQEGFGLVYIEANACGLPALGSNIAGVAEAVKDDESGLLADPNNVEDIREKLGYLIEKNYRLKLSLSAFKRFKKGFTNIKMAKNTLKILD